MKTISIANQKGGMGKTPKAVHLTYAANEKGLRVLVIDYDPQSSLGLSFPPEEEGDFVRTSHLFFNDGVDRPLEKLKSGITIIRADKDGLKKVIAADQKIIKHPAAFLAKFKDDFDICVMDTPPSLSNCLLGALCASNFVITPTKVGLYELYGVNDLFETINEVRTRFGNPRLKFLGIMPTLIDTRSPDEMAGLRGLQETFTKAVLPYYLPSRASMKQATMKRKPVWVGTKGSAHLAAAREWQAACADTLARMGL